MSGKNLQYWFSPVHAQVASATRTTIPLIPKETESTTPQHNSPSNSNNPDMSHGGQWSCPGCPLYFDDSTALNSHCAQTHPDLETQYHRFCLTCQQIVSKGPIHFTTSPKHPKCAGCRTGFEDKARLREHLRSENACETCMIHHGSHEDLQLHYLSAVNEPSAESTSATPTVLQPRPIRSHLFLTSSTSLSPSHGSSESPTCHSDSKGEGSISPAPAARMAMTRKVLDGVIDEPTPSYITSGSSTSVNEKTRERSEELDDEASNVSHVGRSNTTPDGMSSVGRRPASPCSAIADNTAAWSSGHSTTSIISQDLRSLSRRGNEIMARHPGDFIRHTDITTQPSEPLDAPSESSRSESSYSRHSAELPTATQERIHAYLRSTSQSTPIQDSRDMQAQVHEWDTSWRCRSCHRVPCIEPVATFCGHIFCRSCILLELGEHGVCPVCKKMFLLRLDIASHR
ncbi:hypothetical protein GY45DRAFT_6509 [Cubamyces sp. BRFM 1775]|nr:hypothetical protein GY45DRAFT_6509 [Cubamyces sp. BRFM 1775]